MIGVRGLGIQEEPAIAPVPVPTPAPVADPVLGLCDVMTVHAVLPS